MTDLMDAAHAWTAVAAAWDANADEIDDHSAAATDELVTRLDNVETVVLDATAIDRGDASCDVVVSRMGLMFALDPSLAFAEIRRVLRPGGRLGVLTWGAMEHNPWMTCVGMAAMMNGLTAGGLPTGPGGIFSLSDRATLEQLAHGAGFVDVHVGVMPVTLRASTVDEHVERVSSLAG